MHPTPLCMKPWNFGVSIYLYIASFSSSLSHNYLILCIIILVFQNTRLLSQFVSPQTGMILPRTYTSKLVVPGSCMLTLVCVVTICYVMYVYMYVCIYLCMYVYIYVCMYVYMYMYVCMYACTYLRMYVCMHNCIYVCMYIIIYMYYMCMCVYMYQCSK